MSFRTDILEAIEDIRSVPGDLDIRQHRVFVVVRAWDGPRVGVGLSTTTETELLVSGYPPKVREMSLKDVVASGGLYVAGDIEVGPITPNHAKGGTAPSVYNPDVGSTPSEVYFRVEGPGLPTGGAHFSRVGDSTMKSFSHKLTLRQSGRQP